MSWYSTVPEGIEGSTVWQLLASGLYDNRGARWSGSPSYIPTGHHHVQTERWFIVVFVELVEFLSKDKHTSTSTFCAP